MRSWIFALVILAAPAVAQQAPALDGKAALSGVVADSLATSKQPLSKEAVRSLIIAYIHKTPQTPEEKDFFAELASGKAVETLANGKAIKIAALTGEPLKLANLLNNPPNLNTLWKQPGEPTLTLLEVSHWGERGRNRVTGYMANMLYAAWQNSSVQNAYRAWVSEYNGAVNAFDLLEDPAQKREAKLLLKDAMIQVFAKCKADARVAPPKFLYDLPLESVGVPMPMP